MRFLRNPDVKAVLRLYAAITILGTLAAFFLIENKLATILLLCISSAFTAVYLVVSRKKSEKINNFSQNVKKTLHGCRDICFDDFDEGDFAILQDTISKMTLTLIEQADAHENDKLFLSEALADISHQIKTPLTSISLNAELFARSDIDAQKRMKVAKHLLDMISKIDELVSMLLKMSKIDAQVVHFKERKVSVERAINMALEPLLVSFDLKNLTAKVNINPDISYIGDLMWSVEAFSNVLKNCMEHTPEHGCVEINAIENVLYTEIVIKDTGSGIDVEDLPHIFERFYKGKMSSVNSVGIGLAFTKMVINGQGGKITAENNPDKGAKFTIRFNKGIV